MQNKYTVIQVPASPLAKEAYYAGLNRFKKTVGWHTGGYAEYWPGGPKRILGLGGEYVLALTKLEELCRFAAEKGSGPLADALRNKMTELGLLRMD